MYKHYDISRNDLCPCGSGLKYKKCCMRKQQSDLPTGSSPTYFDLEVDWDNDYFELNKAIAYKGTIGRQRKNFCESYLRYKQSKFIEVEQNLIARAKVKNGTPTCKKGCSACCVLYHEVNIQECEVIVYYLLHNEGAYTNLLNNYSKWRSRVRAGSDIFKRAKQNWQQFSAELVGVRDPGQFLDISRRGSERDKQIRKDYEVQTIPCPFLDNQLCSIYEVRPYVCAGHASITPKEWCDPVSSMHAQAIEIHWIPEEIMEQRELFYKNLGGPVFTFTPIVVYEILKGGFSYLSNLPGFFLLSEKVSRDPEINSIFARYGKKLPVVSKIVNSQL
jgi:Fe-S-cluster containining protein